MDDGFRNGTTDPNGNDDALARGAAAEDPYALLGVPRGASLLEVKRGYREKVKTCHPDLGSEPGRVEEFKRLTRAYKTLSDLLSRPHHAAAHAAAAGNPAAAAQPQPQQPPAERVDPAKEAERAALRDLVGAGRARLDARDYAGAETMARAALARSRECAEAYVLMGESLAARELFAEAAGCARLALQIAPGNAAARALLQRLRDRQE